MLRPEMIKQMLGRGARDQNELSGIIYTTAAMGIGDDFMNQLQEDKGVNLKSGAEILNRAEKIGKKLDQKYRGKFNTAEVGRWVNGLRDWSNIIPMNVVMKLRNKKLTEV